MSTKIYNGFRLKGVKSLDKAFEMMPNLRKTITEAVTQRTAKLLAERACFLYDETKLKGETLGNSAVIAARHAIDDELREAAKDRRRCYYDLGFTLSFARTSDKNVIGLVFSEDKEIKKLFMSQPGIVEYNYWNNVDEPDDVPADEWKRRRGHWNEVLDSPGIPAEEMFNITFVQEYFLPYPERELVANNIIPFERRLHRIAEQITMDRAVKENNLTSPGEIVRYMMASNKNTTYQAMLEEEKAKLSEQLKHDLTIEDLQEKI